MMCPEASMWKPRGDGRSQRRQQREPSQQGYEALDDFGPDRARLEADAELSKSEFDALAIGEEEEGAEVERNARLKQQGDDTEQDRVAEGVAENVHAARVRRLDAVAAWGCGSDRARAMCSSILARRSGA